VVCTTKSRGTVIHFAISSLSHKVLAFLLENNATIPHDIEGTLQKPSKNRHEDAEYRKVCEAILNRKKKMDNTGNHDQNRQTTMTPFWSPLVGSLYCVKIQVLITVSRGIIFQNLGKKQVSAGQPQKRFTKLLVKLKATFLSLSKASTN
jgi:hypothetical protein